MYYSILFMELSITLDVNEFQEQLGRAFTKSQSKGHEMYETDFGYVDEALISKGVGISYHDHKNKKKIKLFVHPCLLIGGNITKLWKPTSGNITRLCDALNKVIGNYFHEEHTLDDFTLPRIDFAADIEVDNREKVDDYVKLLRGIGKVKCFSPLKHDKHGGVIDKDCYFALKGNSRGVEFWAYRPKDEKRTLRAEVRLTTKDVIKVFSDEPNTSELINVMATNSRHVFMDIFQYIVPRGDHYKKMKAMDIIQKKVPEAKMRRKMIRLLALIPEKKSIHLAHKEMNDRNIWDVMAAFTSIGLSPITISKRHGVKRLDGLYSYLD